jgi:hypothetical protein
MGEFFPEVMGERGAGAAWVGESASEFQLFGPPPHRGGRFAAREAAANRLEALEIT